MLNEVEIFNIDASKAEGGMIEVYKVPHGVYEEWVTSELVNEMD